MENFNWTEFTRRIAVKSTLADVYNAWTKASEIEKWFLSEAVFFNTAKEPVDKHKTIEKGFGYEWRWYLYDPTEQGMITEANGCDFIQFTFAGQCLVDIKLTVEGDDVVVALTQKNIPTDESSKKNIRLGCDSGWSFFLVNLKSVYESGHDLQNKNPERKGMLNN